MDIQLNQIIFQIINFSVVFFVLVKFLFKPIQNVLEQRAQKIEEGLKAAEKNIKAQDEVEQEKKEILTTARKEASKITKEAKTKAQSDADEILSLAKKEAKKVIDKERAALMAGIDSEREELQSSVADLVTKTAKVLLKKYLTSKEQEKIIGMQLKELKNIKLSS